MLKNQTNKEKRKIYESSAGMASKKSEDHSTQLLGIKIHLLLISMHVKSDYSYSLLL